MLDFWNREWKASTVSSKNKTGLSLYSFNILLRRTIAREFASNNRKSQPLQTLTRLGALDQSSDSGTPLTEIR